MSNPEDRLRDLELGSAEARSRAENQKYGGRTSLMAGGIWFASGAFVTKCLLEMSGKAEHMTDARQYTFIALGGIAAAAAVIRKGYRAQGIHPLELVSQRRNERKADRLKAEGDELSSWISGPRELSPTDEMVVAQFAKNLDQNLGP